MDIKRAKRCPVAPGILSGRALKGAQRMNLYRASRGEKIRNPFDVKYVKHAARVGAELGADMVKVMYTGSVASFKDVVAGCPVPVVIAGGEKMESEEELLQVVAKSLKAGGAGVSIGRNVFQHKAPMKMVAAIGAIVHKNKSVAAALRMLRKKT